MNLLTGATIVIRKTDDGQYEARVIVGYSGRTAIASDPATAIGMAVILQAGLSMNQLVFQLQEEKAAK
jgi:hypothetical protein